MNDQRHIFVGRDGTEWFRDPRMGIEDRLKDYGPTDLARVREANFPTVNERDEWPAATWTVNVASLEASGEGGDKDTARYNASVLFTVTTPSGNASCPMHLELLQVENREMDGMRIQMPTQYDEVYEALCAVYEPQPRYQTIIFGGREYIAYCVPHSE
jgi:hypothetical protein